MTTTSTRYIPMLSVQIHVCSYDQATLGSNPEDRSGEATDHSKDGAEEEAYHSGRGIWAIHWTRHLLIGQICPKHMLPGCVKSLTGEYHRSTADHHRTCACGKGCEETRGSLLATNSLTGAEIFCCQQAALWWRLYSHWVFSISASFRMFLRSSTWTKSWIFLSRSNGTSLSCRKCLSLWRFQPWNLLTTWFTCQLRSIAMFLWCKASRSMWKCRWSSMRRLRYGQTSPVGIHSPFFLAV